VFNVRLAEAEPMFPHARPHSFTGAACSGWLGSPWRSRYSHHRMCRRLVHEALNISGYCVFFRSLFERARAWRR